MHESFWTKARRALRCLYKAKLDIKVYPKPMRNRLSVHYAADKARARERAANYAAAADIDDAALVVVVHPCRCDPKGSARLLPCYC